MGAEPTAPTIEVVQIDPGHEVLHRGRRTSRRVIIDRVWEVRLDGQEIGRIMYRMVTHETRSRGKRYVNSRWQSPGYVMYAPRTVTPGARPGYGPRGIGCPSKKKAVERLVAEATGQAW